MCDEFWKKHFQKITRFRCLWWISRHLDKKNLRRDRFGNMQRVMCYIRAPRSVMLKKYLLTCWIIALLIPEIKVGSGIGFFQNLTRSGRFLFWNFPGRVERRPEYFFVRSKKILFKGSFKGSGFELKEKCARY